MKPRVLLLCGAFASIVAALPAFFSRESIYLDVAGAFESRSGERSLPALLNAMAFAWQKGGVIAVEALLFSVTFLPWVALFAVLSILLTRLPARVASALHRIVIVGMLILGAHGLWQTYHAYRNEIRNPSLCGPLRLIREASAIEGRTLLDPRASAWAAMFNIPHAPDIPTSETLLECLRSPLAWRTEHRKSPFSSVVLTYPFANSLPLLKMLADSREWTLSTIDSHGVVFSSSSVGTQPASTNVAQHLFNSQRDQAFWLSGTALILNQISQPASASALMEEALDLAPSNPRVLAMAASLSGAHGKWQLAKTQAESAVSEDRKSISARYLLALACLKTGSLDRALEESSSLVALAPNDARSHLLRARIAEAANDPTTETTSLERLLQITRQQNQPTDGVSILLGQAWSRAGFPNQALEHYRAALNGELTPEQRTTILENIDLIESKSLQKR